MAICSAGGVGEAGEAGEDIGVAAGGMTGTLAGEEACNGRHTAPECSTNRMLSATSESQTCDGFGLAAGEAACF